MPNIIDLTGQTFGKLTVVEFMGRKNHHSWFRCVCECGGETTTTSNNLRRIHTVSCGCVNEKLFREASFTHRLCKHPLYVSWIGMRNRCYYKKHNRYKHYGGKGIKVCAEWKDNFQCFYDWSIANGWARGLSIDRKENDKDYCPENCKFSTVKEQSRNRTSNIIITINGITRIATEWAEITGGNATTIRSRFKKGWTPEESVYGRLKKINLCSK